MKKLCLFICIAVSLAIFLGASVWEGAAAVAREGELPETGLYMGTNSFPVNTVIDVTNLENGQTISLIVTSGLDSPGLLAILSKDAANAIGLGSRSLGRIRMSESSERAPFSHFTDGLAAFGDADYDPAAFVALNSNDSLLAGEENSKTEKAESDRIESGELIVDLAEAENAGTAKEHPTEVHEPIIPGPDYALAMVPAENRPPEKAREPDSADFIPPVASYDEVNSGEALVGPDSAYFVSPIIQAPKAAAPEPYSNLPDPYLFVEPVKEVPAAVPVIAQPAVRQDDEPPLFSAPLITSLEKGKYYLQIAAYSKAETVKSEISKIDNNLPVAIMNAGSAEKPVYRILIGPVNLGESGALLQRFRGTYKDAFVRQGS